MSDKQGPLGAPRPLGIAPFSQSERFQNTFIMGGASSEPVFKGDPVDVAIIVTTSDNDALTMLDGLRAYAQELQEFFELELEFYGDGVGEAQPTGNRLEMAAIQMHIRGGDSEVTLSQLEDGAKNELAKGGSPDNVVAYKR